jgi:hypothetical protein
MEIEKLGGTEKRLYELVAPLVMRPNVLRQNNNYPFKTTPKHIWFVALEEDQVLGFMPVEIKDNVAVINNYYVLGDDLLLLKDLLQKLIVSMEEEYQIQSVSHAHHLSVFQEIGFDVIRTWKLYVKMEYRKK